MARRTTHKDVEFQVSNDATNETIGTYRTMAAAAANALASAASTGQELVIDVLVWSESGARWYGGDDAVASYREDPDASVFERLEIRVSYVGRVA